METKSLIIVTLLLLEVAATAFAQGDLNAGGSALPVDPAQPADPAKPVDPAQPAGPAQPVDPAQPTGPAQPADPAQPGGGAQPADPAQPGGGAQPADPAQPVVRPKPRKHHNPPKHHKKHKKTKDGHEAGGPAGGIPKAGSKPQVEFGGLEESIAAGAAGGAGGAAPSNKKWCIAKAGIQKSLLKKDYEELCKVVNCAPTTGAGLCYTESIFAKASFAMNLKYQIHGQQDADCVYEGRAEITNKDPSWGKCVMVAS